MVYSCQASSTDRACSRPRWARWGSTCPTTRDNGIRGPLNVEFATAASLNTAYADLLTEWARRTSSTWHSSSASTSAHILGTAPALQSMRGEVGIALGQAALTVEEQATMFNTLANNGEYIDAACRPADHLRAP